MGPDDIFDGVHISFFILFVRTGLPSIGGTSPDVAIRFELPCEHLTPAGKCLGQRCGTVGKKLCPSVHGRPFPKRLFRGYEGIVSHFAPLLMRTGRYTPTHNVAVWLINTGWIGGPDGERERVELTLTRAMVRAVLSQNSIIQKRGFNRSSAFIFPSLFRTCLRNPESKRYLEGARPCFGT